MNRRGRTFAWDQPEREWAGLKWPSCLGWFGSSWLSTENAQGSGWLLFSNQTNQDWALSDSCPPSIAEGKESALTCPWWVYSCKNPKHKIYPLNRFLIYYMVLLCIWAWYGTEDPWNVLTLHDSILFWINFVCAPQLELDFSPLPHPRSSLNQHFGTILPSIMLTLIITGVVRVSNPASW